MLEPFAPQRRKRRIPRVEVNEVCPHCGRGPVVVLPVPPAEPAAAPADPPAEAKGSGAETAAAIPPAAVVESQPVNPNANQLPQKRTRSKKQAA